MPTLSDKKVYSISELTRQIRQTLEDEIGRVWVEGEISNFKVYGSGHSYFVLKDAGAQLSAVLFAGTRSALPPALRLEDGKRVRALGEITVFEGRGQYQLKILKIEETGLGDLMRRFEELKHKLQAEGLFDTARKRPLPRLPQRIGIVTSPTGAVIHDMLTVLGRRYPNLQIRLAPVKVQGAGASEEIAAAVALFNRVCGPGSEWPADVLIVGRGGGSLEDLWAFNEESVARAVAGSAIPVISAVGHEVDFSLCDFAADLRAPTPSAAAELVIAPKSEFEAEVTRLARALRQALQQRAAELRSRLAAVRASSALRRPRQMTERLSQQVDTLGLRLEHAVAQRVQEERQRAAQVIGRLDMLRERRVRQVEARLVLDERRLSQACRLQVERARTRVAAVERQLALLSPLSVLERGYSLTRTAEGVLVRSVADAAPGTALVTQVKDGMIRSEVMEGEHAGSPVR
jgi:exodeoxyribonuclease VII large subunit